MILSNTAIWRALDEGRLVITPEPAPRTAPLESDPNVPCPYQTSSVDLRLGSEIAYFKDGLALNIDLQRGKFATLFGSNSTRVAISEEQPFVLKPGKFELANTLEVVELPIVDPSLGPCLAARVEGRSSFARCGLLVHFTAPTIHAGFAGRITLEVINLGPIPITLAPGASICQLILEEVSGAPVRNASQFQGQQSPGGGR